MSLTPDFADCFYTNRADFTALASSASEGSLLSGQNLQPTLPATFLRRFGQAFGLRARGVFSNTGTPTLTFQLRLGSTQGASNLTGTSIAVSAAITTSSGVSNKYWELQADFIVNTPGQGSGNTTLSGAGTVMSMSGFGTPFVFPMEPTTPDTATWTSTVDNSVQLYLNLSATWSASSSSNTITCKSLYCWSWN